MPSFSIPLSGLAANSQALSIIANNLANMNTVGYKASRPVFQDLFYQQVSSSGDGSTIEIGVGGALGSVSMVTTQGSIESTGIPTDVAIQGDGLFAIDKGGTRFYTRAGNFALDANGNLTSADGGLVLGYPAVGGVISGNQTLSPLAIQPGQVNPAQATTNLELGMNLDANAAVGDTFQTSTVVYDSLGASHVVSVTMTKNAVNTWDYDITVPAADVGQTGSPVSLNTGQLAFDGAGQLTSPAGDISGINISNLATGANPIDFTWQLRDAAGTSTVTQVSGASAVSMTRQDGYASGTLQSFRIDGDGTIEGIFTNGQTQALGQIALATFANMQGLSRAGTNNFVETLVSGAASIGAPGTGGRGSVAGGALETANVDIAREFAALIIAQRGFQANSRAISAFDSVTQEAINLIR